MTATIRLLTVPEIAKSYGQEPHRIYLLAHRKNWRRVKWQGRVYYHVEDVDKDLGTDAVSLT